MRKNHDSLRESLATSCSPSRRPALRTAKHGDNALRDRRGAAAFEFALLLPMFVAMMLGTIQYGTLYYTYSAMIGAARTATRAIAIGSQNATTAEATARTNLPKWVPAGDVTVAITDGAAGTQVVTQISTPSTKATIIPYLPMPASVVARVVMIKEG